MTTNDLLLLMQRRDLLHGWVDMHTHPLAHLGFSGKLLHGGNDIGSLLPTDSQCRNHVRASDMGHALGPDNPTHGGWDALKNICGDDIRQQVINNVQKENKAVQTPFMARGAPDFRDWPKWNDITHQKMWVDWIQRAHWGGLRVMVALAVHNQTLAAAVAGPGDGPMDDKGSMDLQIDEIKAFVSRHGFMEVAYRPEDLRNIVSSNKIAIVIGVEIDAIGNFHNGTNPSLQMLKAEILRLHGKGVRYIFPIHIIDNKLGGTAVYEKGFDFSNYREYGEFWSLQKSLPTDKITYRYAADSGFDLAVAFVKVSKLDIDPFRNPPAPPKCVSGTGHMNSKGLTPLGEGAIKEMMRLGMMIDIDHMSQKSANRALEIAKSVVNGGYPLNSGHNGPRTSAPQDTEYQRTEVQMQRIAALGGMFGLGTDGIDAPTFVKWYNQVLNQTGNRGVGIGTDTNGLAKGPRPRGVAIQYDGDFPMSATGTKTWNYNEEGVAHYGMLADFLRDINGLDGGRAVIDGLNRSAEDFARMWERCERQKYKV